MFPRQLEATSILPASSGGKFDFFIAGILMEPVAITLPGPEPERAPIKVLDITATYPAPPVKRPSSARIISTVASMIPVLVSMIDIAVNTNIE